MIHVYKLKISRASGPTACQIPSTSSCSRFLVRWTTGLQFYNPFPCCWISFGLLGLHLEQRSLQDGSRVRFSCFFFCFWMLLEPILKFSCILSDTDICINIHHIRLYPSQIRPYPPISTISSHILPRSTNTYRIV